MNEKETVLRLLNEENIPYLLTEHEPARTMDDCFTVQTLRAGAQMPKNVFLCNRQKTAFYLMLLEPFAPFRTAEVSKALGVSRLSFAPPEALHAMLRLSPGAVSPLALCFDTENAIRLAVDDRLRAHEFLCFHPLVNTATVTLRGTDFFGAFLSSVRHEATFVHLAEAAEASAHV